MTIVRLLRIEGNVLHIGGADMLDGTPLLDIKPFVPVFDQPEHVRFGWIQARVEAERDGAEVRRVSDDRFHTS
jgi:tRNA (Thr-GGU) A37 N-methylase